MATKSSADVSKAAKNSAAESIDASDDALAVLLNRLKTSVDPEEVSELSRQIEQVIFHKQFQNA